MLFQSLRRDAPHCNLTCSSFSLRACQDGFNRSDATPLIATSRRMRSRAGRRWFQSLRRDAPHCNLSSYAAEYGSAFGGVSIAPTRRPSLQPDARERQRPASTDGVSIAPTRRSSLQQTCRRGISRCSSSRFNRSDATLLIATASIGHAATPCTKKFQSLRRDAPHCNPVK